MLGNSLPYDTMVSTLGSYTAVRPLKAKKDPIHRGPLLLGANFNLWAADIVTRPFHVTVP